MLHDEQVRLGENKYSTLKKVHFFLLNYIYIYIFQFVIEFKELFFFNIH